MAKLQSKSQASSNQDPSLVYQLKSLHEEIDLFDRKIAHLDKYGSDVPSAAPDRAKLVTKRNTLEKTARQMAADGVEFDVTRLPRSFRPAEQVAVAAE